MGVSGFDRYDELVSWCKQG